MYLILRATTGLFFVVLPILRRLDRDVIVESAATTLTDVITSGAPRPTGLFFVVLPILRRLDREVIVESAATPVWLHSPH